MECTVFIYRVLRLCNEGPVRSEVAKSALVRKQPRISPEAQLLIGEACTKHTYSTFPARLHLFAGSEPPLFTGFHFVAFLSRPLESPTMAS